MTVVVRDLVPAFLEFWSAPDRWWDEYVAQHPDVLNDFTRMGRIPTPEQVQKALASYADLEPRIRANAPHALYLAVELIRDERSAQILAAHEIAHAVQFPLPEQPWPDDSPLGLCIYSEGFATALTAELFPQYGLAEHLWFGPGYDDWLADCEEQYPKARAAILADLDSEDDGVLGRFLMMRDRTDFPKRIGYFVGTRLIQELRRYHSWPELARWSTDRAMREIRTRLELGHD